MDDYFPSYLACIEHTQGTEPHSRHSLETQGGKDKRQRRHMHVINFLELAAKGEN
jgi:hypothetical protein